MSDRIRKINATQKTSPFTCRKCKATVYAFSCTCGRPMQQKPMKTWDDVEKIECPRCKSSSRYSADWDAKFCERCNMWLEKKCIEKEPSDGEKWECPVECWKRPERPLNE